MYNIEIKICSKNGWQTPDEARKYYGKYSRQGITWHWWGDPGLNPDSAHDNIVNYIAGKAQRGTGSVNYVLSNNKITLMVNPDNVAWASQNGNPTTISVELSPNLNAEGYKKAGWLAWQLKQRYNRDLQYYPHNYWFSTQCPGSISLDRIRQEQQKWESGAYNPGPTPKPDPTPTPIPPTTDVPVVFEKTESATYVTNKQPTNLYQVNKSSWNGIGVVKSFNKGEKIDIYGIVKNATLGSEHYITKHSYDNKIPNGFSKADLEPWVAPIPEPPKPVEPEIVPISLVMMYTLANAKLIDIKTGNVIKEFAVDTPMEIMGKSIFNSKEYFLTKYAVENDTKQGFLVGDLQLEPTPPPTPEPSKPEWEENLREIDETKYWFTKEQKLIDITTGKPAITKGLETVLEKDDEFIARAETEAHGIKYRLTEYSYKKGIFNGVPVDSLTITEPGQPDIPPIEPTPPVDKNVIIAFLESLVAAIQAFINSLKN